MGHDGETVDSGEGDVSVIAEHYRPGLVIRMMADELTAWDRMLLDYEQARGTLYEHIKSGVSSESDFAALREREQ
jgi:hypothetical protein